MVYLHNNDIIKIKYKWDKVFKNGPSKICGRQPLKNPFKFFKGCLPQILLGPFLNTLSQISLFTYFLDYQQIS